ncbi:MAG: acyl-CoA synthetase [Pseudomonadota bacterium]
MTAPASTADWRQTRERSNRAALRIISWVAVHGGRPAARLLLWPITAYFLLFGRAAGRHSQRYLARVLGRPPSWRERWKHFFHFASVVLDRVYFLRDQRHCFDLQVRGAEHLQQVLAAGRGAIVVGGHLGSFEALAAAGRQMAGLNIAMAMYPDNARMINAALEAIAPGFRMRVIALGQRNAMLAVRDWLDGGGVVGLLADRALAPAGAKAGTKGQASPEANGDTLWLPFLGHDAPFGLGPFRLAQLLRRPVVFMVGLYNGGRCYELRFEPLADFSGPLAGTSRDEALHTAVRAFATRLESICRETPFNWFNFHDFWHEEAARDGFRPMAVGPAAAGPGDQRVCAGTGRADGPAGADQVR